MSFKAKHCGLFFPRVSWKLLCKHHEDILFTIRANNALFIINPNFSETSLPSCLNPPARVLVVLVVSIPLLKCSVSLTQVANWIPKSLS